MEQRKKKLSLEIKGREGVNTFCHGMNNLIIVIDAGHNQISGQQKKKTAPENCVHLS